MLNKNCEGKNQIKGHKVRRLTIQPKYRFNEYRQAIINPEIKLCGNWLERLGFEYGKQVTVTPVDGALLIRLVE